MHMKYVTELSCSLAGRACGWYTQSLIPRLISPFYEEKSGYEASTHMHIHNHTHLLDNLIILYQLIIVLPHQQHKSGFAPKERVKEGEEEVRKGGRGGREREEEVRKGETTINKQPLQR